MINNIAQPQGPALDNPQSKSNDQIGDGHGKSQEDFASVDIMKEVDSLFGGDSDGTGNVGAGRTEPNSKDFRSAQFEGDNMSQFTKQPSPQGTSQNQGTDFDQELEDTKGDPVKLARLLQSRLDKQIAQANKQAKSLEQYQTAAEFLNMVYEDPETRNAFIAELAPDLMKPETPDSYVKRKLGEEFGKEFTPEREERDDPTSRTYAYFRRANQLWEEASKEGQKLPKTLKELREQRIKEAREAEQKSYQTKLEVMDAMKWSPERYNNFAVWAQALYGTPLALAKLHEYFVSQTGKERRATAPNLAMHPGQPVSRNAMFADLDKFFG